MCSVDISSPIPIYLDLHNAYYKRNEQHKVNEKLSSKVEKLLKNNTSNVLCFFFISILKNIFSYDHYFLFFF